MSEILEETKNSVVLQKDEPPTWGDIERQIKRVLKEYAIGADTPVRSISASVSIGGSHVHVITVHVDVIPDSKK